MNPAPALRAAGILVAVLAAALSGCGSSTFTASEAVAEINRNGGELALGEPLGSIDDGPELYSLSFTGAAPTPADVHAGGSLLVASDDDSALTEFRRCEEAVSLVCFRAANVVLMFEGAVQQADLARLSEAIRAMASD